MVDNILQLWSDYETYNSQGIDVGVATVSLCNKTCLTYVYEMSKSSYTMASAYLIVIITTLCVVLATYM